MRSLGNGGYSGSGRNFGGSSSGSRSFGGFRANGPLTSSKEEDPLTNYPVHNNDLRGNILTIKQLIVT